ncbi:ABC transporter permease [Spiractinospora alimapuensis]|uniref:ABC transporter permease n=1 Tax=Spiractinospora alimapuensis TaxID=2820884 RepID=UPI001F21047D|nr:ABC transporter permease [Spiractinospora alimapuensis]QVQ50133.1 ABC transporter permease [Spiractinospora alimapuensis]
MYLTTPLLMRHNVARAVRVPGWLFIALAQPALYLLFFGPIVERFSEPFGIDPWLMFVPGILVLLGLFSGMSAGFGIVAELRAGAVERHRVTPAPRASLLLGRVLPEGAAVSAQGVIVVALGWLLGIRPDWVGLALTLVLVGVFTVGVASICVALGLAVRNENGVSAITNSLNLPLMLLAGILLPMELAPGWLEFLSHLNPVTYTVNAARALTAGEFLGADALVGTSVTLVVAALLVTISVRRFHRENA